MYINDVWTSNLKEVLKVIMDNCGDVDFNVEYDEIYEIGDIIDDPSSNIIIQLDEIILKLGYKKDEIRFLRNALGRLLEQFTKFKPNVEDYYESSVSQFQIFLKLGAAYREKYESARFYKTKSARALN